MSQETVGHAVVCESYPSDIVYITAHNSLVYAVGLSRKTLSLS